jgi:hypothetical protein
MLGNPRNSEDESNSAKASDTQSEAIDNSTERANQNEDASRIDSPVNLDPKEVSDDGLVAPEAPVAAPPAAILDLKEYCDQHDLNCKIETDPTYAVLEIKNGRSTRSVIIGPEAANSLRGFPIEDLTFLGNYSAVSSYKERWIEAAIRELGLGLDNFIARSSIFGHLPKGDGEVEIPGPGGLKLRLTEKRGILWQLDYGSSLYFRIENVEISEHDEAMRLLEDLSNSLFMQIDFRFDSPLALGRDRFSSTRALKSNGQLDQDNQLTYPRFQYESGPSSLYWYARSATSMPLLQFLAFYQCIEFFFPQFSRAGMISRIKNVLKNPSFDSTKDSDINSILNATLGGRQGQLLEERKQLGATLRHCVDATALRDFLNETEERRNYYEDGYKKISNKKILLSNEAGILDQTAERIYDIRCKVVHAKNLEGSDLGEMILPFSEEAELMAEDVELAKFLARKVLIAASVPLGA